MILKSFEVEKNINTIQNLKFVLIYGENVGLKDVLKKKIITCNKKAEIINLYQEDLSKKKDLISAEVKNISLFAKNKLIIINQANEKNLIEIEELLDCKEDVKIILIGDLLDKRSKLRSLFEKQSNLGIIPCYNDTEITLRILVQNELKDYKNLNADMVSMILNYSNLNRRTVITNLEKVKSFYDTKVLAEDSLEVLLNSDRNEIFENIRDAALNGDKQRLNTLIGNFAFANEDVYLYLNKINYRLIKLLDIYKENEKNGDLNITISKMRPPIFWKDKPIILKLIKKWDKQRIVEALEYLSKIERRIKKNTAINNLTVVKNSITNICSNSWSYF